MIEADEEALEDYELAEAASAKRKLNLEGSTETSKFAKH